MLFAHCVATNKINLLTLAQSGLATGLLCLSYALEMMSPALEMVSPALEMVSPALEMVSPASVFFVSFCFIYLHVL